MLLNPYFIKTNNTPVVYTHLTHTSGEANSETIIFN